MSTLILSSQMRYFGTVQSNFDHLVVMQYVNDIAVSLIACVH